MPILDSLQLIIGINKCGTRGADLLKKVLFKQNKLKTLVLDYTENYIGDAGASFIGEGLTYQKALEYLKVTLNFNSISDRGAIDVAKSIHSLKHQPKYIDLRLS